MSLAVPTPLHHSIGRALLEHGIHVLVEKPIATTVAEARELIDVARAHGCTLQVGHLERFNPAILAAAGRLKQLRFVESHRLAPFKLRGTDVSVVLDLMIHDIDLIQSWSARRSRASTRSARRCSPTRSTSPMRASASGRLRRQHDGEPHQHEAGAQAAHLPGRRLPVDRPAAEDPDRDPQEGRGAGGIAGAGVDRGRFVRSGRCVAGGDRGVPALGARGQSARRERRGRPARARDGDADHPSRAESAQQSV